METEIKNKVCENCEGTGKEKYSCCGDEMEGSIYEDIGLCPTCKEHTGGECYECHGSGIAQSQYRVSFYVDNGSHSFKKELWVNAETEEETRNEIKKYANRRNLVIDEITEIEKVR